MEASQNSVSTLETTIQDEVDLARIGYTQQLKRRFTIWSMLAFSSCLLGTWEGLSFTLISALQSGGPASLMYGLLLAWVGTLSNAASLAEISSIYPTAGAQYHWAYCLSPPSIRVFASYIVGWIGCSGLVAAGASVAFIAGVQVQGLIILCHPEIEPRAWIVVVVFWGVILFSGLMNVFAVRLLPLFTLGSCTPFPSPR
jgi:choline transport protein